MEPRDCRLPSQIHFCSCRPGSFLRQAPKKIIRIFAIIWQPTHGERQSSANQANSIANFDDSDWRRSLVSANFTFPGSRERHQKVLVCLSQNLEHLTAFFDSLGLLRSRKRLLHLASPHTGPSLSLFGFSWGLCASCCLARRHRLLAY